jgi:hypothetical protein
MRAGSPIRENTVSNSQKDRGDWSSRSESLFQAARADHDATASDRQRVAAALARRLPGGAATTLTLDGDAQVVAHKQVSGFTLANVAKLTVGVSLVVVSTLGIMRAADEPAEQPRTVPLATQASAPSDTVPEVRVSEAAPTVAATSIERPRVVEPEDDRPQRTPSRAPRARSASGKQSASAQAATARERSTLAAANPAFAKGPASTEAAPAPSNSKVSTVAASARTESAALSQPSPAERPGSTTVQAKAEPTRIDESVDARAELALVERIHAAMRASKPSAALALCAEHERRWPHGTFAQERDAVRAIASCDTKSTQAESRARAFLAAHPRAPLAPRVATACSAALSAKPVANF